MHTMRGIAVLAAASMALTGLAACGGDVEPTVSTSTKSPRTPVGGGRTTDAAGSPSPGDSGTNTEDIPKAVPVAAKKNTKEGAAAFGEYYFNEFGRASHTGRTDLLSPLGLEDCPPCQQSVQDIESDNRKSLTRSPNPYTLTNVRASKRTDEGYKVTMHVDVETHHVYKDGEAVADVDATTYTLTEQVVWRAGRWRISDWSIS